MKRLSLAALSLLFCSTASAQPKPEAAKDTVRYERRTLIEFSDVQVTGEVTRPEGVLIRGHRNAKFRSLIRYRGDFRPELLSSLERL